MADRAVTPMVEKLLTVGIVLVFTSLTATTLVGGAVPEYRDAVGAEVGERVLATATERVEGGVPPPAGRVRATTAVDLPATIRGSAYRIAVRNRSLILDHPEAGIDGRERLVMPDRVDRVSGGWQSGASTVVAVRGDRDGLIVELREEGS